MQAAPIWFELEASIDKAIGLIEAAAKNGKTGRFGEAWLPGYPFWVWVDGPFTNFSDSRNIRAVLWI